MEAQLPAKHLLAEPWVGTESINSLLSPMDITLPVGKGLGDLLNPLIFPSFLPTQPYHRPYAENSQSLSPAPSPSLIPTGKLQVPSLATMLCKL